MDFLRWGLSQFIVQTVFHSAIIAIIVEALISLWHIQKPALQIRFRFFALLPVVYLPFYFLLDPTRTSAHFHEQVALIDFNSWLKLRLLGDIAIWHLFLVLLVLTASFFLFREAIPSIRYSLRSRSSLPPVRPGQFPKLDGVLAKLARNNHSRMPKVLLSADAVPMVYTLIHKTLFISEGTINMLDSEELEAVIAHELAHITGQGYRIAQISLILRFLMFYNPVALFIFRRIVNDNEKYCDDIAVHATGKRLALASGLLRVSWQTDAFGKLSGAGRSRITPRISALEYRFHKALIKERVERLVHPDKTGDLPYTNLRLSVVAALLLAMLFFVV